LYCQVVIAPVNDLQVTFQFIGLEPGSV